MAQSKQQSNKMNIFTTKRAMDGCHEDLFTYLNIFDWIFVSGQKNVGLKPSLLLVRLITKYQIIVILCTAYNVEFYEELLSLNTV